MFLRVAALATVVASLGVTACESPQEVRSRTTVLENEAGGTYKRPLHIATPWAQENCAKYGKNAVLTIQKHLNNTFECR